MAASMTQTSRAQLQAWYRTDEATVMARLVALAEVPATATRRIETHTADLINLIRATDTGSWQLKQLLQDYDLSTDEGIALMCLAEALLRVPDNDTADRLIADKLNAANWSSHAGFDRPMFINAAAWALMLGKQTVASEDDDQSDGFNGHHKLLSRLGAPVVRTALRAAMKALGELFVFSESIENALSTAKQENRSLQHYSFDMLGEAACTATQADHFFAEYMHAIKQLARGETQLASPAISVKLSALHPLYRPQKRASVVHDMYPKLLTLCLAAMQAEVSLCLDAEEADRLELSLDLFEKLLEEPSLDGWDGLGIAVQAYQKRAYPLLVWLTQKTREAGRKLQVRLVKGAYWDAEIKACQVLGLSEFPVFTRKVNTDISYLACARFLLAQRDILLPQFATHNAHTLASIIDLSSAQPGGFELQRLHGMGDILHHRISRDFGVPSRVYAPIGEHTHLLPYLVRRLLENGANSSFVSQVMHLDQTIDHLTRDPVAIFRGLPEARNPNIAIPENIFMPERKNSCGVDFSDPAEAASLYNDMTAACQTWLPMDIHPLIAGVAAASGDDHNRDQGSFIVTNPAANQSVVGNVISASAADATRALQAAHKFAPAWAGLSPQHRAALVDNVAELLQEEKPAFMALCIREAGKTVVDAEAEVREAIDFCRYYAGQARAHADPIVLPGSVGERNELSWQARGTFLCISPWNFPLAILTGQAMAALVTGNPVLLKPAEQSSLIAAMATQLFHRAGIPPEAIQLIPGDGATLAELLLPRRELKGVAFTGSLGTAHSIQVTLANQREEIIPLIAETGGQNAMIVDATALPEQVVRDVLVSAFASAGQRCSCLRILYVQDSIADPLLILLKGAMAQLQVGDPWLIASDLGPVISSQAAEELTAHIEKMRLVAQAVYSPPLPKDVPPAGHFIGPSLIELADSRQLQGEVFGPILHVVRYSANDIDQVITSINATGFGLTLGIHSRIDAFSRYVAERVNVGNVYINRHMTGAVVGSQPFGGRGASGTGFKAGGPHYLYRFMTEKCISVDTTAAGGNASLLGES